MKKCVIDVLRIDFVVICRCWWKSCRETFRRSSTSAGCLHGRRFTQGAFFHGWLGVDGYLHVYILSVFHLYDLFALLPLHCVTFQVDASLTLLLLLLCCRCVFCMSVFFLIGLRPFPQYPAHEASPFTALPNTKNDTFSDIDVDIILL